MLCSVYKVKYNLSALTETDLYFKVVLCLEKSLLATLLSAFSLVLKPDKTFIIYSAFLGKAVAFSYLPELWNDPRML